MKIAICGGRNYEPRLVFEWMEGNFMLLYPDASTVIHGACGQNIDRLGRIIGRMKGADKGAQDWCAFRGFPVRPTPANWTIYGRHRAGPIRNLEMIVNNHPVAGVIAFPGAGGTLDMINQAKKFDIPVRYVNW